MISRQFSLLSLGLLALGTMQAMHIEPKEFLASQLQTLGPDYVKVKFLRELRAMRTQSLAQNERETAAIVAVKAGSALLRAGYTTTDCVQDTRKFDIKSEVENAKKLLLLLIESE